jgi:hypothetical protein
VGIKQGGAFTRNADLPRAQRGPRIVLAEGVTTRARARGDEP